MRTAALPAAKPRSRDMRIYRQTAERGIHLVRVSPSGTESPAALTEFGDAWMELEHSRQQRRLRLAAMSLGASFAPGIWLAHALLVHMHVL